MRKEFTVIDEQDVLAWKRVLALCRFAPAEKVCLLTGPKSRCDNRDVALHVLQDLGAQLAHVHVSTSGKLQGERTAQLGVTPITGNRAVIDALCGMDLIIDLMGLLHSEEQGEILAAGARMLMVVEPPEVLRRLVPEAHDKDRVMAADRRLRAAKSMHVTSKAGTDLSLTVGVFPTLPEYGFADEPGHWDHWPSGFTSTWPKAGVGGGRIVLDVGDMLFPMKMYLQSRIEMEVEAGFIRSIRGGFEAEFLKAHIESYRDGNAYAISHVGWGLQPRARWTALGLLDKSQTLGMDARAFHGNFLMSTGPNSEAGGQNFSQCHVDIPMRNCSVSLDGEPIVVDGQVVAADQAWPRPDAAHA
jgi:2,5-dihydroxypyridine 5,6-dioxygenase